MAEPTTPLRRPSRVSTPESRASIQTSESTSGEIAFDVFVKDIASGSDQARLALAQQLKDAGFWKGKISSKFDIKYYTALLELEKNHQGQVALDKMIGSTTSVTRYDVLANTIAEGGEGDGGSKGPQKNTYVTSASQTAKLLNAVAVDLLERNLTKAEQTKYLKMINAEQRRQPSVETQGDGFSTTIGGVDEQQFITEKLEATSEAKNVRATDAYTILMKEFGGLR
tara:strand:+ start:1566 stop:2243 length:678 start_codon:yes stop_codon:yes gene_type:complete